VRLKHAGGVVDAKGFVDTAQRRDFRFEGGRAFRSAAFVEMPAGDLNFSFVALGRRRSVAVDAHLDIAQSRLGNLPTSGTARIAADRSRIANADVHLAIGESKIDATGAFGRAGDTLQFACAPPTFRCRRKRWASPPAEASTPRAR
jgi:translocation and assembly module TamB